MPKFLSDKEMEEVEAITKPRFMSDEDMAKAEAPPAAPERSIGEQLGRGAIKALPAAFALGGGLLGGGPTPMGVAGAGLGYAAGSELEGLLNHYVMGDEAPSADPIDQARRVAGNVATGAASEVGGQVLSKGLGAAGSALKNTVDDVATAPLGQMGERGFVASGLQKAHQLGAKGNQVMDDLMPSGLPAGLAKIGRYGLATKAQGVVDALEQTPRVAQWAAGKASPLLETAGQKIGPYAQELAQRSPQLLQSLRGKMGGQELGPKPYDKNAILMKTQGTKYEKSLRDAAQRGDEAFNATYYVLQSNPEFRAAVGGPEQED